MLLDHLVDDLVFGGVRQVSVDPVQTALVDVDAKERGFQRPRQFNGVADFGNPDPKMVFHPTIAESPPFVPGLGFGRVGFGVIPKLLLKLPDVFGPVVVEPAAGISQPLGQFLAVVFPVNKIF